MLNQIRGRLSLRFCANIPLDYIEVRAAFKAAIYREIAHADCRIIQESALFKLFYQPTENNFDLIIRGLRGVVSPHKDSIKDMIRTRRYTVYCGT